MKKKIKDTKFLKILIWVIIALIIIVGFIGVYTNRLNKLTNIIPEYNFGMDISGNREFNLVIDDSENEKKVYVDSQGNIAGEVINEEKQVDGYTIENKKIKANNEEYLTVDNYKKTKEIIEKRIKNLKINEYNLKVNNQTGNIVIELPQNADTDKNYSMLISEGKFEIVDNQTGIVLMDNNDIVKVFPTMNQSSTNGYDIYLQVEFNEMGTEKIKNISNKYIEYTEEGKEESTIDYIAFKLDGTILYTTYFAEEWTSNSIYIPIANNITDSNQLNETYTSASYIAYIINSGKLPVKYSLESDEFIKSTITQKNIEIFKYIILGGLILILTILTIKYKLKGLELGIINIGFTAIYSIIIRYLKIEINLPGIIAIISIIIMNLILYYNILKNKDFNKAIKEFNVLIIPFMIIAIVFTLTNNINTLSIGMLTFWGIVISELYNLIVLKIILKK